MRLRIGAKDVERLVRGHPEPATLSGREPPEPCMAAPVNPVLGDDLARLVSDSVAAEKIAIVTAAEEARFLALRSSGSGQAGPLRLGSSLVLRLLTEREPDSFQQARIESREHV